MANVEVNQLQKHIDSFLEYLDVEKNSSKLTIRNYRFYLKRFNEWLARTHKGDSVEQITVDVVRKFRVYLSNY